MKTFFKALLLIAPVCAVMLWYVWGKQDIQEHKIDKEVVKHDQQFNRVMKEVSTDQQNKKSYGNDEKAATAKLAEMENREKKDIAEKQKVLDAAKKDFDAAVKEYDSK